MEVVFIKNKLIDAVETAKSIHEGDYSSLRGKYFVTRDKIRENNHHSGDKPVKKSRIDRLEGRMNQLENKVDHLETSIDKRTDRLETKVDQLGMTVEKLAKIVVDGFNRVDKRIDNIETRIDNLEKRIDARLDYIVKANNLKDSK